MKQTADHIWLVSFMDYDLGTSTTRPVDSSRSKTPSGRDCYLCLRNNLLPMSPEWTPQIWRPRRDSLGRCARGNPIYQNVSRGVKSEIKWYRWQSPKWMIDSANLPKRFAPILTTRESLNPPKIQRFLARSRRLIVQYRGRRQREQRERSPNERAFRAWSEELVTGLESCLLLLQNDAIPSESLRVGNSRFFDELDHERTKTARDMDSFKTWLVWQGLNQPKNPKHRPVDWIRADLEEGIGAALHASGVRPTKTVGGTYFRILQEAYAAIGLPRDRDPHKAARVACDRHPEWKEKPARANTA